jgi:hypothetical protein
MRGLYKSGEGKTFSATILLLDVTEQTIDTPVARGRL